MPLDRFSRRSFLQGTAAGAAVLSLGDIKQAAAQAKVTIGIIYVGPKDDFGWNQAHAVNVAALRSLPNVSIVEEENVPETAAVLKSMESMINLEGANLILATSFGYFNPFMVDAAKKYPRVTFRHAAPLWDKDKHPANAGSYFGYLDQAHYVNGVAAGLATKTNKIGFVAAKPISSVLRNINSVLWGARSVNPNVTVQLIFTGDWALPVREAEAANALAGAGCDILTCHVDSPKVVIETAERRGIMSLGHNASQAALAPKGFITGAEYKWETIYKTFADAIAKGQPVPNQLFGGYEKDMVRNTAYGAGASEAARKAADAAIADLKAGRRILKGPVKDNKGAVALPSADGYDNLDRVLDGMNFLAEGVVGSIT